jgi:hypothetical protein
LHVRADGVLTMTTPRRLFDYRHDQFIRSHALKGTKCASVAADLGRREQTVRKRAKALGTPFVWHGRGNPIFRRKPVPFTEAQDALIRIMAERGWKSSTVAERLNRDDGGVRGRAMSLGVRFLPNGSRGWVGFLT